MPMSMSMPTVGIPLKRGIKRAAGWASVALSPIATGTGVCILMYHRIAPITFVDPRADDWNVPPETFERQMQALAEYADVVPLNRLRNATTGSGERPVACITIDDGYASVCQYAIPILQRYGLSATFFVPTAYIGSEVPFPFDRWGLLNHHRVSSDLWRPATWQELERAAKTNLIHIGSHSHHHLAGRVCPLTRLQEETERSREDVQTHLGDDHARAYAYPYGNTRLGDVPAPYESAVRAAGYEVAVTTDPALASAENNPFRLPRLEVHQLDSARVLRAKLRGSLTPYRAIDRLRTAP
jgi:peptidoglycan/xylan/chitin deacetylase (PgdA/CDA1 family)